MSSDLCILLIAGTSHCGKTTFAKRLGTAFQARVVSTDSLARHPGRPWPDPRPHVADYYQNLTDASRLTLLHHHYQTMQGLIREEIVGAQAGQTPLILEGSALRAEYMAAYRQLGCRLLCLTATSANLTQRIYAESDYSDRDVAQRALIDAFVRRSVADQDHHLKVVSATDVPCFDVWDPDSITAILTWIAED